MTNFFTQVFNDKIPEFTFIIGSPKEKVKEIMENDDAAINFARALVSQYDPIEKGKMWLYRGGYKFYIDLQETDASLKELMQNYMLCGEYEPHTTKLFQSLVKDGDVCLDAGASIGYFTMQMAKKASKVYAFEPTLNQVEYLKRNIAGNGFINVEVFPKALWSSEKILNVNGNVNGRDNVEAITLDSLNIPKLDFIKMDIDGSEPEALKGMIQTIERSPDLTMVIEYYPEYIERLGNKPQDMLDILEKYFTYSIIEGDYGQGCWNYLCRRKK